MSVMTIVACSNGNNDANDNNNNNQPSSGAFQKTIDQLFQEQKLSFNFKNPVITEDLFVKNQNNLPVLKKAFALENKTEQNFNFELVKAEIVNQEVVVNIKITNQNQEQAFQTIKLTKSFTIDQQSYVNQVYRIIGDNLQFKPEFANQKLTDLLANVKSEKEITNWLIKEEFLGIKIKYLIPSQNINATSGFNVNYLLFDEDDKQWNPNSNLGPKFVKLASELITPLTLLFENDFQNATDRFKDLGDYFGQVFLLTSEINSNKNANLTIGSNFTNKHITGKLDFSNFQNITFESAASFSSNEITALTFAANSQVTNLKSDLFTNNKLSEVNLPQTVEQFNVGAFDAGVKILGLETQTFIKQFYDPAKKELFLNKLKSADKVAEAFTYLTKLQNSTTITLKKVYLPNFTFNSDENIVTDEIVFNSAIEATEAKVETFTTDLSRWTINNPINIPESVLLIDKKLLPASATINRQINAAVLNLIDQNNTLSLDQEIPLLKQENKPFILFDNLDKLDQLFWTFNSQVDKINQLTTIVLKNKELNGNSILSYDNVSKLRQAINFFKQVTATNKQIKIDKKFKRISYESFNDFKDELSSSSITITRDKPDNFNFLDLNSNKLNLDQFYANQETTNQNNLFEFLLGFEDQIRTIEKSASITKIVNTTFKSLKFKQQVDLNLENITVIEANAFYQTQNLNLIWPSTSVLTEVGDYAFYRTNANLTNKTLSKATKIGSWAFYSTTNSDQLTELDLSAATQIGSSAFYSTSLKAVKLSQQISTIENSAFSNAGLISLTLPTSVTTINDYAFADNRNLTITNLDLSKVTKIGNGAFRSAKQISQVTFSDQLTTISDYTFSNVGLTSLTLPNSVTTIGASAFDGNPIVSASLNLSNVKTIGASAFNNTQSISAVVITKAEQIGANAFYNAGLTTLKLPNTLTSVGQNAFAGNNQLKTVEGINFDTINVVNVFGSTTIQSGTTNLNPPADYKTILGYGDANKKLDLNKTNDLNQTKLFNLLTLLLKEVQNFAEVILPNYVDQNLIDLLTSNTTIQKLTWKTTGRKMTFSLNGKTNIKSLSNDFVQGMDEIPANAFANMNMSAMQEQEFSLNSVVKVGSLAFKNSGIKKFSDTTSLKEIASQAFDYQTTMVLGTEVKLEDDSFSVTNQSDSKLPATVSRNQIFNQSSKYWQIYKKDTKVLDFTKAEIAGKKFFSRDDWKEYLDIGLYLLDGDVKEIILPEVYVIWNGFVNGLGQVDKITFQTLNQQIYNGAFTNTNIANKPDQNQTNIIYDGDNFFTK